MTSFKMAANDNFNLSEKRCTKNQIFCLRCHIFHAIRHIIWTLRSEDGHVFRDKIKFYVCMNVCKQYNQ